MLDTFLSDCDVALTVLAGGADREVDRAPLLGGLFFLIFLTGQQEPLVGFEPGSDSPSDETSIIPAACVPTNPSSFTTGHLMNHQHIAQEQLVLEYFPS